MNKFLKRLPQQCSSSLYPTAASTPSTGPWWLSSVFAAAADIRLLSQPGTKTRGTQRSSRAQRGTEKLERYNKCTEQSCTTDCCKQRKLNHKQKSRFPVHVCLTWVQWHLVKEDELIQVVLLQPQRHAQGEKHVFSPPTACCITVATSNPGEELLIWHLQKGPAWYRNMPLCAILQTAFEVCTFLCHTCFWWQRMEPCLWGVTLSKH